MRFIAGFIWFEKKFFGTKTDCGRFLFILSGLRARRKAMMRVGEGSLKAKVTRLGRDLGEKSRYHGILIAFRFYLCGI